MHFIETKLTGAYLVEIEPYIDQRGYFARTFCAQEFLKQGLVSNFVQTSLSVNPKRGTLRGLHYQTPPHCEVKLVRCTNGSIYDVIVDLRPESPTYLQHIGVELSAKNRKALYVPEMFAHGLQTLEDNTEVLYSISTFYSPEASIGLNYKDPRLGIQWPLPVTSLSEKDQNSPML